MRTVIKATALIFFVVWLLVATVIVGEKVGDGAESPPRLCVVTFDPRNAETPRKDRLACSEGGNRSDVLVFGTHIILDPSDNAVWVYLPDIPDQSAPRYETPVDAPPEG